MEPYKRDVLDKLEDRLNWSRKHAQEIGLEWSYDDCLATFIEEVKRGEHWDADEADAIWNQSRKHDAELEHDWDDVIIPADSSSEFATEINGIVSLEPTKYHIMFPGADKQEN